MTPNRSLHPLLISLSLVVFVLSFALSTQAWADGSSDRFSSSSSGSSADFSSSGRPRINIDIDIDIDVGGGDGETPQKTKAVEQLVRSVDAMDLEIDGTAVASATANSLGQIFIKWDSRHHALPLGAESVVDLAGKQIVIATKDGMSLLEGTIPDLMMEPTDGDEPDVMTDHKLNIRIVIEDSIDFEDAVGKLQIKYCPSSDRSKMKMKSCRSFVRN